MTAAQVGAREYLRVSADKSGRMASPAEQHAENERTAQAQGWHLGEPYTETGAVSASRYGHKSRAGFGALVSDLGKGTFGAEILILWEPSRGSRRLSEWARFLELLEAAGVRLHVTSHGRTYDLSNARDRRSLHEDGTDSEYESAKISGRATRTCAARAAAGKPHGRVPFGYVRQYALSPSGRREISGQVPDPAQAAVVERVFTDIGRGTSLRQIAASLNADGIPAPGGGTWTSQTVRDLALNPAMAGLRLHVAGRRQGHDRTRAGTLGPGDWPAIVAPEVWHATRALLTDPSRRTARPGRDKHLLSMIAICAVCNGPLSVRYRGGNSYYFCRGGGHVRVPQAGLDEFVTALVLGRLAAPDEYQRVTARDSSGEVQAARDDLAGLRAHHADLTRALATRQISVSAFAAAEPTILADIGRAEARLREAEAPSGLRMLGLDPGQDIAARWGAASMTARREVSRILFAQIAVGRASVLGRPAGGRAGITGRVAVAWREDRTAILSG